MCADIAGNAPPGGAAHACANLLDRRHQRKAEQHHPAHCIAELCPGLGISGDAAGVVVGGGGDQSRAKAAEQAFVRGAARGVAQGDAGRQHGNCPVISVGIGYAAGAALSRSEDSSAAAGLRARVFRGLRHLIRLLIDTVLDLWKIPAQSLEELDNLGDFLLAENCELQRTNVAMSVEFIPCFWAD
jgi:hypothetical protein